MRAIAGGLILICVAATAAAAPHGSIVVPVAPQPHVRALAGQTLYLDKCEGGCSVTPGPDDATQDRSQLVAAPVVLPEHAWKPGEWEAIVACVKEVYSPYNVAVTDARPDGSLYDEVIVAGGYGSIGVPPSCGYAPGAGDCSVLENSVAFVFVDEAVPDGCYDLYSTWEAGNAVFGMCWLVAQESAHMFGLDHAYGTFDSGQSTCDDPMTYSHDCGGEKFFRNDFAPCNGNDGKVKPACGFTESCGTRQNAHLKLLADFGPSTPTTAAPVATITSPTAGASVSAGAVVVATASAQRGVARIELWINGYKWGEAKGVPFGADGQPAASYPIAIPSGVPDSVLDLVMKAFDDIDIAGDSAVVTVTKGKAGGCDPSVANSDGTFDTCLAGQQCSAGKCAWADAGQGAFGDACTYPQFCGGNTECVGTATSKICTHECDPSITDSCPKGFECDTSGGSGICFTPPAGCCSAGGSPAAPLVLAGVTLIAIRRRRKIG